MKKQIPAVTPGKLRTYVRNGIRVAVHPRTKVEFIAWSPAGLKTLLQKLGNIGPKEPKISPEAA